MKHITLYHFTAKRFAPSIYMRGIAIGAIPVRLTRPIEILRGYQWLTSNGNWDQKWAEGTGRLPYKRNEVRFTVQIPMSQSILLKQWTDVGPSLVPQETYDILTSCGDPENWWVFAGTIPPDWLTHCENKPELKQATI